MNMFYLIPFDLNTSAFTQVLLPSETIGNRKKTDLSQSFWFRSQSAVNLFHFDRFRRKFLGMEFVRSLMMCLLACRYSLMHLVQNQALLDLSLIHI